MRKAKAELVDITSRASTEIQPDNYVIYQEIKSTMDASLWIKALHYREKAIQLDPLGFCEDFGAWKWSSI